MIQMFTKKRRKGFTLIELVVVVAILGILLAIAIPRFSNFQYSSRVGADLSTARQIVNAARIQETQTGTAVANLAGINTNIMTDPGNAQSSGGAFSLTKDATSGLYTVEFTATAALAGPYAGLNKVDETGILNKTTP